ncbi:MAG: tyrosine--tRNA ligase [Fibrobacteres bacterium]|nr:tyrosine--tRNA ligase [Fibrobacterota bacterium]
MISAKEQLEILRRGVIELIDEKDLLAKLEKSVATGKPLRVKMGVDPTAPDIHLGFTVGMRKLRQFQDLGHQVVLIVGDYTATVGDPSGKSKTRARLTHEQVLKNAESYKEQFFQIVDRDKTEVVYNGEWFRTLTFDKVTELMSRITVAQMLERQDFQNRHAAGNPISLHEFLYPLMQGLDSVMIEADVELGGTDQKFNVLRGRELQRDPALCDVFGKPHQEPQVGLFVPILLGTCGQEKMSKSLGNYVGITEAPQVMYHKIYSIPDPQVADWTTLLTDMPLTEIDSRKASLVSDPSSINAWKAWLAHEIVRQYHGLEAADQAREREAAVHRGEALPDDTPMVSRGSTANLLDLLVEVGAVPSRGEGKKLLQNGGVQIDGEKVSDPGQALPAGEFVLRAGKRKFWKVG